MTPSSVTTPGIDQVGVRGIKGNGAGIQQGPVLAIDVQLIATEVARIARIKSLVGSRSDGAVEFRNQEGVAVIDRENGRANGHFQGHGYPPQARRPGWVLIRGRATASRLGPRPAAAP